MIILTLNNKLKVQAFGRFQELLSMIREEVIIPGLKQKLYQQAGAVVQARGGILILLKM